MSGIKKIFLDLDDVLNTFTMSALLEMGCVKCKYDESIYPVELGYDIVGAANELIGEDRWDRKSFFAGLSKKFWANIEPSRESILFANWCCKLVGAGNVYILTAPVDTNKCYAGKHLWIKNNLPRWLARNAIFCTAKHVCANNESVLIDDSDKNVNEFREHGGKAVLVPRPWNSKNEDSNDCIIATKIAITKVFGLKETTWLYGSARDG